MPLALSVRMPAPSPAPPRHLALALLLAAALLAPAPAAANTAPASSTAPDICRAAIGVAEREAGIPPGLLQAIGRVESGRRDPATGQVAPWPWTINVEGAGNYFPTKAEAIAAVRQAQARGARLIDVGCMQINLHHHPNAFASLDEAFDPLANARYGARFLKELQATRGDWLRAAGNYHSNTPERAEGYRAAVAAALPGEQQRLANGGAPAWNSAWSGGGGGVPFGSRGGQILPGTGGAGSPAGTALRSERGRGLDAYRSAPIPLVSRQMALLSTPPVRPPLGALPGAR